MVRALTMTKIVGIVLVKNEDIFITLAIRNILAFCDEIIVADNFSTDGTWAQLEQLAAANRKIMLLRIRNAKQSHRLLEGYAGKDVFVFGVDGDEIYDPAGLARMRGRILDGAYDNRWCLYGHALHCTDVDVDAGLATGFQTPEARSMTKLYNFGLLKSWDEPHQQRLHGHAMEFHDGHSVKDSLRSFQRQPWDQSPYRCLHMCFVPRSTESGETLGLGARKNISELNTQRDLGAGWKVQHYAVGAPVTRALSPFLVNSTAEELASIRTALGR